MSVEDHTTYVCWLAAVEKGARVRLPASVPACLPACLSACFLCEFHFEIAMTHSAKPAAAASCDETSVDRRQSNRCRLSSDVTKSTCCDLLHVINETYCYILDKFLIGFHVS